MGVCLALAHEADPEGSDGRLVDLSACALFDEWPRHALAHITKSDLWLIEQLFSRGRTEADIATPIGVTQQAVNKRKWMILLRLRRFMAGTLSQQGDVFLPRIDCGNPRVAEPGLVRPLKK
jgi:hypothetical protein